MMGIYIIADVSRGEITFFDKSGALPIMGGSVILAAEDAYESILRPKLRLANADLDKVFFLPPSTNIPDDLEKIDKELTRLKDSNIRILFIDPLSSFTTQSLTVESSAARNTGSSGRIGSQT